MGQPNFSTEELSAADAPASVHRSDRTDLIGAEALQQSSQGGAAARLVQDQTLFQIALLNSNLYRVQNRHTKTRPRKAVRQGTQVVNLVASLSQSALKDDISMRERAKPEKRALARFERIIDVLAADQLDIYIPSNRRVFAQDLNQFQIEMTAEIDLELFGLDPRLLSDSVGNRIEIGTEQPCMEAA